MSKEFYDKYGKLVDCFSCNCIEPCSKSDSPICSEGYVFFAKDKIADLEAKLAESEEFLVATKWKVQDLNKQLSDTEAQNKRVLEKLDLIVRSNQELEKQHDIDNQVIQLMEDNREKDKISFCIEQLEKVKELLFSKAIQITGTSVDSVRLYSINEIFSNQIKQLKEMK